MATVMIALVRPYVEKVKPPRALFVPFPFGYALGKPNDPAYQHRVLAATFDLLNAPRGPVIADFEADESEFPQLIQASAVQPRTAEGPQDPAAEVTALRGYYERFVEEHGGRTMVGLSRVPQQRFRGVVRFLEAYARGDEVDIPERPREVSLAQFIRYCSDDLKAFFYEARMAERPGERQEGVHHWFWGDTAMGRLLVAVARRMAESDDPEVKAIAFGIAR